jgi:transposase
MGGAEVGDVVAMSRKERARLAEVRMVAEGREKLVEAARRLGVSYRQMKRIWGRYRESGDRGLVHRSRGRASNRARSEAEREACLSICRERLAGFGPTLAAEKLSEWGVAEVDHETLRRWMKREGLWSRARRRGEHRMWRERKRRFGELVQMDGSHHDWFGTGHRSCLMNLVDDATTTTIGRMEGEETTAGAMRSLWGWVEAFGIPLALYCDGKNVYVTDREATAEEQLAGEEPLTAFGRACRRLGIEIVRAYSPQAKGRVERSHGVYQDRLVKELRVRGVKTIEGANELLEGGFVARLNEKFAQAPACDEDAHRPVPAGLDLASIFVFEDRRRVANDWTIRHENRYYQITGPRETMPRPKARVTVQRRLDGSLHILYREHELTFREVPLEARVKPKASAGTTVRPTLPTRSSIPAPAHPWRRPFSRNAPSLTHRTRVAAPSSTTP